MASSPDFMEVGSFGKLLLPKNFKPGDIMIRLGEYLGADSNQYGALYNFLDNGEKVTLPKSGKLDYMAKNGDLKVGAKYMVIYNGKQPVTKGPFKGKEFHDYIIKLDRNSVKQAAPALEEVGKQMEFPSDDDDLLS